MPYFDLPEKLPANKEVAAFIREQQSRIFEAEQQRLQAACAQREVVRKQFEQVSQELAMIQKQHYVAPLITVDQIPLRESFMQSLDGVLEELVPIQAVALAAAAVATVAAAAVEAAVEAAAPVAPVQQ